VPLLFIVRPSVFVPQQVKGVENGFGASKRQIAELRLSLRVEAHDFAIQHAATALEVTAQSLGKTGKALKRISITGNETHALLVGVQQ
jgi:hypothetical protein